jgi:UDP-2,4-diacetamido-2,4,6-trideoxy-beta-L-altropyranose hydrolase
MVKGSEMSTSTSTGASHPIKSCVHDIELRRANLNDSRMLFGWRNLPEIIALSGSGQSVTWAEHEKWFSRRLDEEQRLLYIVVWREEPVGQVRLDRAEDDRDLWKASAKFIGHAVVSIYLLPEKTGLGLGPVALSRVCRLGFDQWNDLTTVVAFVLSKNLPAERLFEKCGFVRSTTPFRSDEGRPLTLFQLNRERAREYLPYP